MPRDTASPFERFATGRYQPVTFLERGIALPFTTPQLMGGRIRPGPRQGPELVLANPAGVEGVYIVPWSALPDICAPSLHDRTLWARIARQHLLTPRSVRDAARGVAAEGFAGREAARAATSATQAQEQAKVLVHYHLLLELVRQGEATGGGQGAPPPEQDTPAQVERRARAVLEARRDGGSLTPAAAVESLEEVAMAFEGIGLRRDPTRARLPRAIAEVAAVMQELVAWGERGAPQDRLCARLLVQSAELTLRCGRIALSTAQGMLDDIWGLLHQWRLAPEVVLNCLARPEWLLDGWELICGLWRASPPAEQSAAALDMASLVPVIPAEARDWVGFDAASDMDGHRGELRRWRRMVQPHQDWMTGRLLDLAWRNETMRALTV